MNIDASEVIARLGIRNPPRIHPNPPPPASRWWHGWSPFAAGMLSGDGEDVYLNPEWSDHVQANPEVITVPGREPEDFTIEATVAHELMHVAQQQRAGSAHLYGRAYLSANVFYGYENNPYELEALEAGRELAHLVRIEP